MIQLKRGTTAGWRKLKTPLAAGQPGYDKDKHKLKIGDGKNLWSALPYASGLAAEDILCSESDAKSRHKLDSEDVSLITYGTNSPNKDTVGQLYLQYYDTDPEVDYVISAGISDGWSYKKWKSGIAECNKVFDVITSVQTSIGDSKLYQNTTAIKAVKYPIEFKEPPSELATVQSPGGLVWLATSKGLNTTKQSAVYRIISGDKLTNSTTYRISLKVEGFWK
jgi:hypothetical protein